MTLAMALAGAAGETVDEMARTLGLEDGRPDLFLANVELLRHYAEDRNPSVCPDYGASGSGIRDGAALFGGYFLRSNF